MGGGRPIRGERKSGLTCPLARRRYEKVMMIMQAILALLLCFSGWNVVAAARPKLTSAATTLTVDQRLGFGLLAFFLYFYYRREQAKEQQRAKNVAALPPGTKNPYEEDPSAGLFGGMGDL